jgi:hypothetical protein
MIAPAVAWQELEKICAMHACMATLAAAEAKEAFGS